MNAEHLPEKVSGAIRPINRAPSTSADGFIYSADGFIDGVDGFPCSVEAARNWDDDKVWQERALPKSGNGKFCSAAVNCPFGVGPWSSSEGNVYRPNAANCFDPPISRFSGVNKTIGRANQTVGRVKHPISGAPRTSAGAKNTSAGEKKTPAGAKKTFDGVNQTISRANKTIGGANKTVHRANETISAGNQHQATGLRNLIALEMA